MTARARLARLFEYIAEQARDVDPRGFSLSRLGGLFRREPAQLRGLPGVALDAGGSDGEPVWLRVPRLEAAPPPSLPERFARLIPAPADPEGPGPAVDEAQLERGLAGIADFARRQGPPGPQGGTPAESPGRAIVPVAALDDDARERLAQAQARFRVAVQEALAAYAVQWQAWAQREAPRRRTMALYDALFALKHQLEAQQTAKPLELVWGLGVATRRLAWEGQDFGCCWPVLTQAVEVTLDEASLALEVRPRAVAPRLELDPYIACGLPGAAELEIAAREALAQLDAPVTPFDLAPLQPLLRRIAGELDSRGSWQPVLALGEPVPAPGEHLVVTDAWVLFARPQTHNLLLDDLRRLRAGLQALPDDAALPPGPAALVTPPLDAPAPVALARLRGLSSRDAGADPREGPVHELYFPLPYNAEQVAIVQRLEAAEGVTVQGPPGTGKTHTIANIICHWLATGRRVLVTSRGEAALQVLQDKIPPEVRPLTVALLAGDREGLRQFQGAIEAIQHRVSQLDPAEAQRGIDAAHEGIALAHEELARIDRRVDAIAQAQLAPQPLDGMPMRAQQLAEQVVRGRERHGWLDDAPAGEPPLDDAAVGALREARRRLGPELARLQAPAPDPAAQASVHQALEAALTLLRAFEAAAGPADHALRARLAEGGFEAERQALQALLEEVPALAPARGEFLRRPVDVPDEALGCVRTREAVARAAQGGRAFGWLAFGEGQAKARVAAMRVEGRAPGAAEDWAHVQRFLALQERVQALLLRWNRLAPELGLPEVEGGAGAARRLEQAARAAALALRVAVEVDAAPALLPGHADAQPPGAASRSMQTSADVARQLRELLRQRALQADLAVVREAAARLAAAGAPRWARRLCEQPAPAQGDDPALPAPWREAWAWAGARARLEGIDARGELSRLWARRAELEASLARLYGQVVSLAAWRATRVNASQKVLSALAGYAGAIQRIGQGTGPNALRHRRDARAAMQEAAAAVPCWIMSHARVSESMPADLGAFDLVIVDEASQSDLWALPAVARGRKVLVVGDHKQVSPDGGFIASGRIDELRQRFLADQPFAAAMTPEKSLYDLAAQVYAGQQVMLREHFRCVAPIIEYANRTFYEGAVLPLRVPRAAERIDPPLVDLFVDGGVRDARDRNDAEAQAIADEIGAVLDDPRLAGRTLGVVSLLGLEQARHIDAVVRARFDAAELLRRRFACGDARTFQGSERDIMFLSLVVDARSCRALSGLGAEQRFNVAASRARDRMVLVRSVQLAELSPKDLRRSLLAHFEQPLQDAAGVHAGLRELCESGFEREVFDALVARGYRVRPQVRAGAWRIDLVVEGAHDARLAVECDGDEFHGPDRWAHDMARQRVLERAGWVFWRCFASTWTLRRDEVFQELLQRLAALGIEPLGAADQAAELVERRVWCRPPPSAAVQAALAPAEGDGAPA